MNAGPRPARHSWLICAALLLAGLALNFQALGREPAPLGLLGIGDSHWYFGPQAAYMDRAIAGGELPQWGPLSFCGQPFAANPQTGLFYPPNLLRSLLTPDPTPLRTHVGLAVLAALHVMLAGLGTFALARAHSLSLGGSLVAAWGFAFSASIVRRALAHQFLGVVVWLPWILLALKRALEQPSRAGRTRALLAAGIVFGCSVLGGFPQLSLYVGAGLAAFVFGTRSLVQREASPRRAAGDLARLLAVALLGALVAAPMLLPAAQFIAASTRVDPGLVPLPELAVVSDYPGLGPLLQALATYPGPAGLDLNYRACGAGMLILALTGLLHRDRRRVGVLLLLFLVFLDCSLGPPLPVSSLLAGVVPAPLITPSRGFILACLPLALLAGYGVDALGGAASCAAGRRACALRSGVVALFGAAVLLALLPGAGTDAGAEVLGRSLASVLAAPVLVCVALVVAGCTGRGAGALLLLLVAAETVLWNRAFVPSLLEQRGYRGSTQALDERQSLPLDNRRFTIREGDDTLYRLRPVTNGYDPLQLSAVHRVLARPELEGTYARSIAPRDVTADNQRGNLLFKRSFWLSRQFVREVLPPKDVLFPVTTTAFLQTTASLDVPEIEARGLTPGSLARPSLARPIVGPGSELAALRWEFARPRQRWRALTPVFDVPARHSALRLRYRSRAAAELELTVIGSEHTERAHTVQVLPTRDGLAQVEVPLPELRSACVRLSVAAEDNPLEIVGLELLSDTADEGQAVRVRAWTANTVTLEVGPLEGARVLTFLDADYPGWSATVDGHEVPIHRSAEAFKAIEVPAGSHEVRFRYVSRRMWTGVLVCLMTLVTCALLALRPGRGELPG